MAQRAPRAHPIHASWLTQIEIHFSIVQRKVLTPNDFKSLNELEQRLLAFQQRHEDTASPFQWTFTRKDLTTLLAKIENKRLPPQPDPKIRHRNSEREHLAKSPAFSLPCFATSC